MLLHGLPTIRQFIWIWKRSSASLFGSATSSFTFRCIQWISSPLPLSLLLPAVLFNPLFLSPFFPAYRSGSAPPSYSHHADRSAGHQRGFISHSETASSLMDGSAILFNFPPLRPPLSLSLFLPTLTPLLACSRFSLSLSLSAAAVVVVSSPARSFSSESIQPLDARLYTAAGYSRKIHEFRCPVIREFRIFRISSPSPLVSSFFWQDTTHGVMVVKHLDDVSKSKSFRFLARFIRDRCILKTFNSGRIVKIRDIFSKRYSKQMFFQRVLSGERRYISCVLREREEIRKTRFDLRCRDGCSEEKKKRKINRARSYVFKVYNFCFMQE